MGRQITQLDNDYVYSKRIYYIDKETFLTYHGSFYDKKGRLYRTTDRLDVFFPECGQIALYSYAWQIDHRDVHSGFQIPIPLPAVLSRKTLKIEEILKMAK